MKQVKSDPDAQYMLRFKDGDPHAFRVLFEGYKKKIINFCYRFCGDGETAEELAQEVFLRVYKAAPKYRPDARFSTWIFRIATNVCLNELRKKRYHWHMESLEVPSGSGEWKMAGEIQDPTPLPQERLEFAERDHMILQAISNLPGKQRAALVLRIFHGFSYREIAGQIKSSESSVKSFIHRGRQSLKQVLAAIFREE
jgi:RNA polymerase sigma-70 factor (ECF subfamily)